MHPIKPTRPSPAIAFAALALGLIAAVALTAVIGSSATTSLSEKETPDRTQLGSRGRLAPGPPGQVRYMQVASSSFDGHLTDSSEAERAWMRDRYWRMRGWSPFFDEHAQEWAPPSHFYRDLYAISNSSNGKAQIAQNPSWVLRDPQGNELYIDYACSGGTCPQYAADIGSPEFRAHWIEQARSSFDEGYQGIFVDDVNLLMRVSDGSGEFVRPVDPRTGRPMTDADWRRYMAEFTEQIRAALPDAAITHNPLWWMDHDDPYVKRQIDAADLIEMERGFNDQGIRGGTGKWGFETYLSHVDWLHGRGKAVIYEASDLGPVSREFELASYFLVNGGRDVIASRSEGVPENWWSGWEADLGAASGPRYAWKGILRRDFERGSVFVNPPDSAATSVRLPSSGFWTNLDGERVTDVTLGSREAAVLLSTKGPLSRLGWPATLTSPTTALPNAESHGAASGRTRGAEA